MSPGSLVVYINFSRKDSHLIKLEIGKVYTVRSFVHAGHILPADPLQWEQEYDCIYIDEIINQPTDYISHFEEDPYMASSFRELLPPMEAEIKELLEEPQLV